jgi:negative regulator of sigma E activity
VRRSVFAVAVAALAAASALWLVHTAAGIDAYRVLESALVSEWLTDYTGEVNVRENGKLTACYTIAHQAPNRDFIQYLPPEHTDLVILRGGDGARCLDPANGETFHIPNGGITSITATNDLIRSNYRVRILATERVAGRPAIRLRVTSRFGSARNREYWVDQEKCLVLCSREVDRMGRPLYEERFVSVRFEPVSVDTVALNDAASALAGQHGAVAERMRLAELSRRLGFAVSEPDQVPKGYVLVGTYLTELDDVSHTNAALFRYTDGLSSISVFQTRHKPAEADRGAEGLCRVTRSGHETMAVIDRAGVRVIAVGSLPASVLSAVAAAVPSSREQATG